jgi:hypothetical protein
LLNTPLGYPVQERRTGDVIIIRVIRSKGKLAAEPSARTGGSPGNDYFSDLYFVT